MTSRPLVVWSDIDLVPEARELLARDAVTVVIQPGQAPSDVDTIDAIVAGSLLQGDAAFFARASRLQAIARSGIGYDRIDVDAATAAGVCAINTPDAPTESTAEFALTLMLAVARKLSLGAGPLAAGEWKQGGALVGFDLAGKTLGLVGCGRIGRRVAELAQAFRMDVQVFDPFASNLPPSVRRVANLADLLASSDVISLHAPLSAATRHLLGPAEFSRIKPGAILINTARGPLIDEAALLEALRTGRLAGAGLDVWDPEPPASDNPLLRLTNVVATPHVAAFTQEGRRRSHVAATAQVLQVLRGEQPPFLLNPAVWSRRRGRAN